MCCGGGGDGSTIVVVSFFLHHLPSYSSFPSFLVLFYILVSALCAPAAVECDGNRGAPGRHFSSVKLSTQTHTHTSKRERAPELCLSSTCVCVDWRRRRATAHTEKRLDKKRRPFLLTSRRLIRSRARYTNAGHNRKNFDAPSYLSLSLSPPLFSNSPLHLAISLLVGREVFSLFFYLSRGAPTVKASAITISLSLPPIPSLLFRLLLLHFTLLS